MTEEKPPNNDKPSHGRPIREYWLTAGAAAIVVAIIAALAALKPWSSTSSTSPPTPPPSRSSAATPTSSPSVTTEAAFVSPASFAANIPPACTLTASGTVERLERNHHLWLFLYFYDDKYFAGNSLTLAKDGVHWSGRIYIGGNKQPGQQFVLWLFDLGPSGWKELNTNIEGQDNGFNGLQLAKDVTRIAYVDFTTGHEKCPALRALS